MQYVIEVENVKCGGCVNTIETNLLKISGIQSTAVDIDNGVITLEANENLRETIVHSLQSLGYPEKGSISGASGLKAKAKSFVSCAIGRMDTGKR